MKYLHFVFILFLCVSCTGDSTYVHRLDEIKHVGDTNPQLAMEMLGSICRDISGNSSEYIRKKSELLETRLRDKAYVEHTDDSLVRELVAFFELRGDNRDRQEAYYYAGSVYRDLRDTPRALKNFLDSESAAEDGECDSVMLLNTYSNLHCLYYNVQSNEKAYDYAMKEYSLAERLHNQDIKTVLHVAVSLIRIYRHEEAIRYLDMAFSMFPHRTPEANQHTAFVLLCHYSYLQQLDKATECYRYIRNHYTPDKYVNHTTRCLMLGRYFSELGNLDSARHYYQTIIDEGSDLLAVYDATRHLFNIEAKKRDSLAAARYAEKYIEVGDSLDLGERQRMATTTDNQYRYYRNAERERRMKEESERRMRWIMILSFSSAFVIAVIIAIYNYIYRRQYRIILKKSEELGSLKDMLAQKDTALDGAKDLLQKKETRLAELDKEMKRYDEELRVKEMQVMERTRQTHSFLRILSQTRMEETAESVIESIRKSAIGRCCLLPDDWKKLYCAVDELYPTFKDRMVQRLGAVSDVQLNVCYLICIGLTDTEIRNLTGLPRVTAWRWAKKFREALDLSHELER